MGRAYLTTPLYYVNAEPHIGHTYTTVLADTFAPSWRATVNGEPWPIHRVNGLFRGVVTDAGEHEIVFTYRPRDLCYGLGITLLTLGACIVAGGVAMRVAPLIVERKH